MHEHLNTAIAEAIDGESSNHYLSAIIREGEVKTLEDFAAYVDANFWGCIWDQVVIDPVATMKAVIADLKKASRGKQTLEQIDTDLEEWFGESAFGNVFDQFAETMRIEVEMLSLAVRYLRSEQARMPKAA